MSDDHGNGRQNGCCGACQNSAAARPRFVVGVFSEAEVANGAAERLRGGTGSKVNVLSSAKPGNGADLEGVPGPGCGRLYDQIHQHLQAGALLVIVDVQSPEQQLGISRVLLESKCDLLLTHDGFRRTD